MAVTYAPFGGRRTYMNDYEQQDARNAALNAQMQQQALGQSAGFAAQRGMADVNSSIAMQELEREYGLRDDYRQGGLDYINFNELGGRDLAAAQNQLGMTQTGTQQQIAGARSQLVNPALDALQSQFAADPQSLSDAGIALISGVNPADNRLRQEELAMRREDRAFNRERQAMLDQRQVAESERGRLEGQRSRIAQRFFEMAMVEMERGNVARGNDLMRQGMAIDTGEVDPADFGMPALDILPEPSPQSPIETANQVVGLVEEVVNTGVDKQALAEEIVRAFNTPEGGTIGRSVQMLVDEAQRRGIPPHVAASEALRVLIADEDIKRAVASQMPRQSSWHMGRVNPIVAIMERKDDTNAAMQALEDMAEGR